MFIVFIGPPGVGKGTQSKRLAKHLGIPHLSTGDMLRAACANGGELGYQVGQFLNQGKLVSDQMVNDIVDCRLREDDCVKGCLFDGFPRTLVQARSLEEILARLNQRLDLVLELKAEEEELSRRMLQRANKEHRSDDSPETIKNRLQIYRTETAPLIGFYQRKGLLTSVEGMGSQDEVFNRIKAALPTKSTPQEVRVRS
jgi:adenylate kinase